MIDTFVQIKQKLALAYQTIKELRDEKAAIDQEYREKEINLALKVIEQLDQCEGQDVQADFLLELLDQMGVSRIPSPIDRSPEYSHVVERIKTEGVASGTVLRVTGGAYVKEGKLIRPAAIVVAG